MNLMSVINEVHACPLDEVAAMLGPIVSREPRTLIALATRIGETGVEPPEELTEACKGQLAALDELDPAEIIVALSETMVKKHVDVALEWLVTIGFIKAYFPELEACRHLQQEPGRHHKDVWEHTKLVVKQAVPRVPVRWAALLHDIGKVPTRTFTDKGVHFHGHAEVGARMFDKLHRRLPFEKKLRRKVRFLIKYHLRSAQYDEDWTDNAIRRFEREMREHLRDLLDLSRADITSKRPGRRRQLLFQISALSNRIDEIVAKDSKLPNLPKGLGNAVMERFEMPASRELGDIIKALNALVEAGELEPRQDFSYYLDYVASSDLAPGSKPASE